jgi:hypothetical protein
VQQGNKVISLLDEIRNDTLEEEKQAHTDEASEQSDYNKAIADLVDAANTLKDVRELKEHD